MILAISMPKSVKSVRAVDLFVFERTFGQSRIFPTSHVSLKGVFIQHAANDEIITASVENGVQNYQQNYHTRSSNRCIPGATLINLYYVITHLGAKIFAGVWSQFIKILNNAVRKDARWPPAWHSTQLAQKSHFVL
jgi:hypothetical protein